MEKVKSINCSIDKELKEVEAMLMDIGKGFTGDSAQDIFNYFFKVPGKYLRPTLILLSANMVNSQITLNQRNQLIKLATAVELIHSASLIHDDIIDGDLIRRGQRTLNNVYGRKIAVLVGDALYAKAFSILSSSLPRAVEQIITEVIENMCTAEIIQARYTDEIIQAQEEEISKESYLKIIKGKTALFLSACCKLGAILSGGGEEEIIALENYGLNFGMVYQIIDDWMDADPNAAKSVTIYDAEYFAEKAKESIEAMKLSVSRKELINLLNYVFDFSRLK